MDDTDALFGSLVVDETGLAASTHAPGALADGTYYWRARAVDSVGNTGAWSDSWSFTIDTTGPSAPNLTSPADAVVIADRQPMLHWEHVTDPSGLETYVVEVDNDPNFDPAMMTAWGFTYNSMNMTLVLPDGTYWWRVRADDNAGNEGAWSEVWTFTVDGTPPEAPDLVSPVHEAIISDSTPSFDWTDVTDPAGGVTYGIQVADNIDFTAPAIDLSDLGVSAYTSTALPDGTYYWRVNATDGLGNEGAWSGAWSFTIDTIEPSAPVLSLPADGLITGDNTPTLDWGDVTDASGVTYDVQVDYVDDAFGSLIVDETGLDDSFFDIIAELPDGTYYWRARAVDNSVPSNTSAWSEVWSFTVDTTAPGAPVLSSPADAQTTGDNTPTLDWGDVTDPSGVTYEVQLDNTDDTFGSLVVDESGLGDSFFDILAPLPDGTYYWRARAVDNAVPANTGAWSEVWSFTVDTTAPAAPALASPSDTEIINDNTPALDWDDVTDPSGLTYELQVDNNAEFLSPAVDEIGLADSFFDVLVTLPDGTYSWRVRAVDGVVPSNVGEWSEVWSFTIDTTAPAAPALTSPPDGALFNDATPTLNWGDVLDISGVDYSLQVASDPDFTTIEIDETGLVDSFFDVLADLPDGAHYWKVMAIDGMGNVGEWSEVWSFTVDTTDPLAPILTSPADGDLTSDNTPSFDWGDVDDPSGVAYSLQVATDAGFASLEIDEIGIGESFFDVLMPLPDDTYYWRVMAVDGATNQSPWSSVWSFTIDTARPLAPVLVSPIDGALINDANPTLDWGDVDDPSGVTYNLLVADNPGFVGPELDETGIADSFFDVLVGLPDGTHYWKVKAVDGAGNPSVSSVIWSFTIDVTSPSTPDLVSPADGVFTKNSTPALDWSNVSDPSGVTYNLQVATDAEFTSIVLDETGLVDSFFDILVPLPNDTYYWRVEAVDGAGNEGAWSEVWTFTVDTIAPAAPILLSPPNGALIPYTPTLDWSDVSDPSDVSYVLRLERASMLLSDPGVSTLAESEYTPGTLSTGTYYWRVKTVDGAGNESDWSPARYFLVDVDPPATPALIAPADGIFVNNAGPSLDWEDAPDYSGIVFYTLEVDDSPLFDSLAVDETDLEDSFFDILVGLPDGTYFWRVKAVDAAGNDSSWSSVWSFIVDTAYPPTPDLLTPADHTYSDDNTPYFDWGAVSDASAVSYLLRVERVTLITAVETLEVLVAESEYTPAPEEALVDGNYYWRVKAIDGAGNEGAWSEARSFTVDALNPPAPALTSPQDGAVTTDTTPTLDWEDVEDPTGITYDIQVSDDGIFAAVVLSKTGLVASQYTLAAGEALADGTYYWRARAVDGAGNPSDWSSDWSFIIDNTGPPIPTLLAPEDEALTNDTTPAFDWEDVVEPNGVSYTLMIDDSDTFATPVRTQVGLATSDYTLTVGEALPDGTYYWRVEAVDDFGNPGGWSDVWSFTVDTVGPPTPTLISPVDGTSTNDTTPTLDWEDVFDPSEVSYDLQVDDTDDSFGSLVVDETGIGDSFFDILVELPDGTYYWRVEAVDGAGNHNGVGASWTEVWTFTVDTAAPAEPTLLLPEDGSYTNDTTPTLDWDDVVDPSGVIYTLEVDDGDTFTSPLFTLIGLGASEYTLSPGEALPEGTYYWRAMAVDGAGNPSGWSSEWSFTIELTSPDAPVLLLPDDGASIDDGTPNFDWESVIDISGVTYTLEIADSDTFDSLALTKTGIDTSGYTLALEEALVSGTYFWRVKTVDGAGNESGWSDTWSFDLAVSAITWRADITAASEYEGSMYAGDITAGVADTAGADDDVMDDYDMPGPPPPPGTGLIAYFSHPGEGFSRDIRLPADTLSWDFIVDPTFTGIQATLTWDVSEVPPEYNVVQLVGWYFSVEAGFKFVKGDVVVADMRTTTEYAYTINAFGYDRFTLEVLVNQAPEVTVTYPNGGETVSGTVQVTADATDADGTVTQVDFEYSPDNGTTWYAIGSDVDGGDGWAVSWDSLSAPFEGTDYLVRATATDNMGSAVSDESDATFEVVFMVTLSTTFASGWNMFSLPVAPEDADFTAVLGDDIDPLYIFWMDTILGSYQRWSIDAPAFDAELGKGYWTRASGAIEVDVTGFLVPETDFIIHLAPGWNQVGHPRNYSVDWENVQVTYEGSTVGIEEAHDNGWVLKFLYGYSPVEGRYVTFEAPDGTLDPWNGYWVRALVECDLVVPAIPMS
ncbi:hypothetical protein ACFLTS_02855 [Chloroflexota bacterium]